MSDIKNESSKNENNKNNESGTSSDLNSKGINANNVGTQNNSEKTKKCAKKTLTGFIVFVIIFILIISFCIYMVLINKNGSNSLISNQDNVFLNIFNSKDDENYIPLKLTDKARLNPIVEIEKQERYGDVVDYYEYTGETTKKLEIKYVLIDGLKDKKIQEKINNAIEQKIKELKDNNIKKLDNQDIFSISISSYIYANYSDVLSICIEENIHYGYNDEDYENDTYENNSYGLNFSLATGNIIDFNELFWKDSPIQDILSKSITDSLLLNMSYYNEDPNWDGNIETLDKSSIEPEVNDFINEYANNPNINYYFTTSTIEIPCDGELYSYTINMVDFYENIAIYTRFKAEENIYEKAPLENDFYVFATNFSSDDVKESKKFSDNVYCIIENVGNNYDSIEMECIKVANNNLYEKINEYVEQFKLEKDKAYVIDAMCMSNKDDEKCGYDIMIEIASCSKEYFDNNLEEILAAGARAIRYDVGPNNYAYVDEDKFEFVLTYSEWCDDYTNLESKGSHVYTNEDRIADEQRYKEETNNNKINDIQEENEELFENNQTQEDNIEFENDNEVFTEINPNLEDNNEQKNVIRGI